MTVPHVKYLLNHGKLKFIGDPCKVNPEHAGIRYTLSNRCAECSYLQKNGVEAVEGLAWVKDEAQTDVFLTPARALVVVPAPFTDSRRNRSAARKATEQGQRDFHGSPCGLCGCTLRFASTASCVACEKIGRATYCDNNRSTLSFKNPDHTAEFIAGKFIPVQRMNIDRQVRMSAEMLKSDRYVGMQCGCGSRIRYTGRGQCVSCVKERNGARTSKKKTAPAQTGAAKGDFDHLFE